MLHQINNFWVAIFSSNNNDIHFTKDLILNNREQEQLNKSSK